MPHTKCPHCGNVKMPEKGEKFWMINLDTLRVIQLIFNGLDYCKRLFEIGNYFTSESQAQAVADKIKKIFEDNTQV